MPFETSTTRISLLSEINTDYLEALGPHTVFVDSREITSDLHDGPENGGHKDVNGGSNGVSTKQYKRKKSLISGLSKLFEIFVSCGSKI
ncbi:hypothetical protein SUGI_0992070 [Cryptomeria japonica]|nr:hypothetical protein SUGI_0992070 [Cryptomeria japonica]